MFYRRLAGTDLDVSVLCIGAFRAAARKPTDAAVFEQAGRAVLLISADLDELLSLFADGESAIRTAPVFGAAPPLPDVYRLGEAFNAAAHALCQKERAPAADGPLLYNHLLDTAHAEMARLLGAVAVENERESPNPFGRYDGVLDSPPVLEQLQQRRRKGSPFSISQFNEFGLCPFLYLCDYLLDLEPLEEPEEALGAQELGSLYHDILHDFYAGLREERPEATELTHETVETLIPRMTVVAREEFAEAVKDGRARDDALWRLQQDIILRRLRLFLENEIAWAKEDAGARRPAYFEISFGPRAGGQDPASKPDALVIDDPGGQKIQIRGMIDRVDIVEGHSGFIIMDYKSGSSVPTRDDMKQGLNFQLPVYLQLVVV
jgi:hypothetical protein